MCDIAIDCCRTICSVLKTNKNKYKLIDAQNKDYINLTKDNIANALAKKTITFWNNRKEDNNACDSRKYVVWILKAYKKTESYVNIASCKSLDDAISNEINVHIRDLFKLSKKRKYRKLWESYDKLEFIEIDVDKYFEKYIDSDPDHSIENQYIRSLVSKDSKPEENEDNAFLLWRKNRAEFIEGKLACELGMTKDNSLWHRSSMGIDGFIYDYYSKQKN